MEEGLFYSSLAKTFPRYKQYLEVKHVEVEQRIELIELKTDSLRLAAMRLLKACLLKECKRLGV
ncbi:hypothetical protein AAAC51_32450 [Priestia megaterium]